MNDDRDSEISETQPLQPRDRSRTSTEEFELSPGQFRHRAGEDFSPPVPQWAAVPAAGAGVYAFGTAVHHFRRASDAGPSRERLPTVDDGTADLRRRVLEARSAGQVMGGLRLPRRWLWRLTPPTAENICAETCGADLSGRLVARGERRDIPAPRANNAVVVFYFNVSSGGGPHLRFGFI